MGSTLAMELSDQVAMDSIKLDQALIWHLTGNHYPPVPTSMVEPCKKAIEFANDGEWNKRVKLPEGITWKGFKTAPASAIIEAHHLEFFLEQEDE